jgi:Uma2 family endonuclease
MATTAALLTVEEFAAIPESAGRFELVRGALRPMMAPLYDHGIVVMAFGSRLLRFAGQDDLGDVMTEVGFVFERDPDTVYLPDIAFVRADRRPPPDERRHYVEMAPDLVVEVLSPSNTANEIAEKVEIYPRAGVRLVWLVNPSRQTVTVHTPDHVARTLFAADTLDGGEVLPGFAVRVGELFA